MTRSIIIENIQASKLTVEKKLTIIHNLINLLTGLL